MNAESAFTTYVITIIIEYNITITELDTREVMELSIVPIRWNFKLKGPLPNFFRKKTDCMITYMGVQIVFS